MSEYYIKVGKIDYYTWKVGAIILLMALIIFIGISNSKPDRQDIGCYKSHVQECNSCHSKNMTYLLCSGFCVNPDKEDLGTFCSIHPQEDCVETIPMECLLK